MLRFEIGTFAKPFLKIRGQNYDGASSLQGVRSGVKVRVLSEEKRALSVHCFAHRTSLAISDTLKMCSLMKNVLNYAIEIEKLVKLSPKRQKSLERIKESEQNESAGIAAFCPTRWTVKMRALCSILINYGPLLKLFDDAKDVESVPDMQARLNGIHHTMLRFEFFFGISLAIEIFGQTDELATVLQNRELSAAVAQTVVEATLNTLKSMNSIEEFDNFWSATKEKAEEYGLEPELPRKRKRPDKYRKESDKSLKFPSTAKEYYQEIYLNAFSSTIGKTVLILKFAKISKSLSHFANANLSFIFLSNLGLH